MSATVYHFPTLPADPVLRAAEKRLRIAMVLAGLPDGDEADDLISEITECELQIFARPARTTAGLISQVDLFKSMIEEGVGFSTTLDLAAADVVAAGLRDWAAGRWRGPPLGEMEAANV